MHVFYEGDWVLCIYAEGAERRLVEGELYKVVAVHGDQVDLGHDGLYESWRFAYDSGPISEPEECG